MSSGVRPPLCAPSDSGNMAIATGKTSRHMSALFRGVIPTLPLLTVRGLYKDRVLWAGGRSMGLTNDWLLPSPLTWPPALVPFVYGYPVAQGYGRRPRLPVVF